MRRSRKNAGSRSSTARKLLDFETEIEGREQRKGNIYKAVVSRVEPSPRSLFRRLRRGPSTASCRFKEISRNYFRDGVDVRTARIQDAIREGDALLVLSREGRARQQGLGADHDGQPGRPLPGG